MSGPAVVLHNDVRREGPRCDVLATAIVVELGVVVCCLVGGGNSLLERMNYEEVMTTGSYSNKRQTGDRSVKGAMIAW